MSDTADREGEGPLWSFLVPALAFFAGLVAASAAFLLFDDTDGGDVTAVPTPSVTTVLVQPTEDALVVQVPSACVEAAEAVEAVTGAVSDVATAVRDLDAREAQDALDVVQKMRPGVESSAEQCLDIAAQGRVVTPSPSPVTPTSPTPVTTPSTAS